MNDVTRIPVPVADTRAPAPPERTAGTIDGGTTFRALLERLQRFAADKPDACAVDSPDELREAMRTADASFTTAMDLRRQLEDAFRRHQP
jgi:hypothetical protein